jgi:predicted nucleotidyltransferase
MADRPEEEYSEYVEAWRKRLAQEESERRMRAKQLREVARACAHRLAEDFGAREVYLFGSLLREDVVHGRSDIDLAVEGLERARCFKALSALWKLLPAGVELDLVPLEDARSGLAERVRAEGELLDAQVRGPTG